jgi:predicted nucleotidyltransferase
MPEISYKLLSNLKNIPSINDYTSVFHYTMITKKIQEISDILDVTEGLENRIDKKAGDTPLTSLIDSVKTKRYTYSKIQRAILHIILNITKEDAASHNNPYIRVLGFRSDKKHILSQLVKKSSVPVITNVKNAHSLLSETAYKKLEKEFTATDIYYMTQNNQRNMDFTHPLVVL